MSIERPFLEPVLENVSEMETEHAKYRIAWSVHTIPNRPETIQGADGVILESILLSPRGAERDFRDHLISSSLQYHEVLWKAAEEETPVFYLDWMTEDSTPIKRERFIDAVLRGTEGMIALGLLAKIDTKTPMTRRKFLGDAGKGLVALFLASPGLEFLFRGRSLKEPEETSFSRRAERVTRSINDVAHPEMRRFAIHTRNDLIAQKSETLAQILSEASQRKPELALILGTSHTGIENSFRKNEKDRINSLKNELGESINKNGTIFRIDFVSHEGRKLSDFTPQELLGEIPEKDFLKDEYWAGVVLDKIRKFIRVTEYIDPAFQNS